MKLCLWFCLVNLLILPAHSADLKIRAGEHAGFSRIVLYPPTHNPWRYKTQPNGFSLRFETPISALDTRKTFERLHSDRVAGIELRNNNQTLFIRYGCPCRTKHFKTPAGLLVFDISRKPRAPTQQLDLHSKGGLVNSIRLEDPAEKRQLPLFVLKSKKPIGPDWLNRPIMQKNESQRDDLERMYKAFLETAQPDQTSTAFELTAVDDAQPGPPQSLITSPKAIAPTQMLHPVFNPLNTGKTPRFECPKPEAIDFQNWSNGKVFHLELAALRSALTGEFDRLNEVKIQELIRFYLAEALAPEARLIIQALAQNSETIDLYFEISQILDATHHQQTKFFQKFQTCSGDIALWAYLAEPIATAAQTTPNWDHSAIAFTFSGLPKAMKKAVAARLSDRFLADKKPKQAALIGRILDTLYSPDSPKQTALKAKLDLYSGAKAHALERLEKSLVQNQTLAPEALISLVDLLIEFDKKPPAGLLDISQGLWRKHRSDSIGKSLELTLIKARILSGKFKTALLRCRPAYHGPEFCHIYYQIMIEKSPDVVFLKLAFTFPENAPKSAFLAAANRLLDLGFYDHATRLSYFGRSTQNTAEERLLQARIGLLKGEETRVLDMLSQVETPKAMAIKAQALTALKQPEAARAIFMRLNDKDSAFKAALSGLNAGTLNALGYPSLAKLVQQPDHRDIHREATGLAKNRESLKSSKNLRAIIMQTLAVPKTQGEKQRP
ncbi:hypothetical protein GN241_18050 [Rhodobacteraceae bacterium IMCC1335]